MIVLYNGGFIVDPIIYIFNLHIVRNKLKQIKARVSKLFPRFETFLAAIFEVIIFLQFFAFTFFLYFFLDAD